MSQQHGHYSVIFRELSDSFFIPRDVEESIMTRFISCSSALNLQRSMCDGGRALQHSPDLHKLLRIWDPCQQNSSRVNDCCSGCSNHILTFRCPYHEHEEEVRVDPSNMVAFMNFVIPTPDLFTLEDRIGEDPLRNGVYVEILTFELNDLLSLSLVDFDGGGNSSLTFNADMGTVISEEKISVASTEFKLVKGRYCNALPQVNSCSSKETPASVAVFLSLTGDITFFRRCAGCDRWESTGIISNCKDWVSGKELVTPCVAFASPGLYQMRIARVESVLPFYVETAFVESRKDIHWTSIAWAGFTRELPQENDEEEIADPSGTDSETEPTDSDEESISTSDSEMTEMER